MAANSSIQEILHLIRTAIYGKEVRESIAEGIEICYEDIQAEGVLHNSDIYTTRIGNTDDYIATINNV